MEYLKSSLLISAVLVACAPPNSDFDEPGIYAEDSSATDSDASAELYALESLPRFDIELASRAIDSLRDKPRKWVDARLLYRGEVVDANLRLKGEYSFRPIDEKASFKIRFDRDDEQARWRGLRGMTLNNNIQDPTMLSQVLAYYFYRDAGIAAPRANLATVYINGDYRGVYTNVESEDLAFIERNFEDGSGNLYEEGKVDFSPGNAQMFDLETNEDLDDRSDLDSLIDALDRAGPDDYVEVVGAEIDLPAFLDFAAIEGIAGGLDGYCYGTGTRNNFRIYRDPQVERFYFIPWGADRLLRPRHDPDLVHSWLEKPNLHPSVWSAQGLLLSKCHESPECREMFIATLEVQLQRLEELGLVELGSQVFELAASAIEADLGMAADFDYVQHARALMSEFLSTRPAAVRAELD